MVKKRSDKELELFGKRISAAIDSHYNDNPPPQIKIAKYLGKTQEMISYMRNGKKMPSVENGVNIARKLGVSFEWLMTGRGQPGLSKPEDPITSELLLIMSKLSDDNKRQVLDFAKYRRTVGDAPAGESYEEMERRLSENMIHDR